MTSFALKIEYSEKECLHIHEGILINPKSEVSESERKKRANLLAQTVKNLPTMQEIQVWSLGQKDLLEKEMATHCSVLAWKIPWTEESGGLQFMRSQRV